MAASLTLNTSLHGGRYVIKNILGQGGFGITYLAEDIMTGATLAIKEFFFSDYCIRDASQSVVVSTVKNTALVERFRQKFVKEAYTLQKLNHKNVVRVYDVFDENYTSYYTMEYVRGRSLLQMIHEAGRLGEADAVRFTEQIGEALAYLHINRINHLDIKPANVMVREGTGDIALIDFGVSKHYDEWGAGTTTTPPGISHGYSPVEQYTAGGVSSFSPQSDIYALGATLYKMVTGNTPPPATSIVENGMLAMPAFVSKNVSNAILSAMQTNRNHRPASVEHFLNILHGNARPTFEGVVDAKGTQLMPKSSPNLMKMLLWIVPLGILLGAGTVFLIRNSQKPTPKIEKKSSAKTDSVVVKEPPKFKTIRLYKTLKTNADLEESSYDIDYPIEGNSILVQNIREWINEQLGGDYMGDLNDHEAFARQAATKINDTETQNVFTIKKAFENDLIVTYTFEYSYYCWGAAHGMEYSSGVTFRKLDGKKFTIDMINGDLQPHIVKGLKKYFEVSTDDELKEQLLEENESIPLPTTAPWIIGNSVYFTYTEYEIACYAAGSPNFTISASIIKPMLTATGKTFFPN